MNDRMLSLLQQLHYWDIVDLAILSLCAGLAFIWYEIDTFKILRSTRNQVTSIYWAFVLIIYLIVFFICAFAF
jgi:hypothetical protein